MQPIISIVGKSNSGKTTLLESLIAELTRRGYQLAVIKHAGEDIELDTVNKDTWRFRKAGSQLAAINAGRGLAVFYTLDHDFAPEELARLLWLDCDLILTEGFKRNDYRKIEVHRQEQGSELLSPTEQLLAVITDEKLNVPVPQFTRDEVGKIADLIEQTYLSKQKKEDIDLIINNERVLLNDETANLLSRTMMAFASRHKKVSEIKRLRLSMRKAK
jgi:molybdopterin-guanine dinucleotide biosynthesis protein B